MPMHFFNTPLTAFFKQTKNRNKFEATEKKKGPENNFFPFLRTKRIGEVFFGILTVPLAQIRSFFHCFCVFWSVNQNNKQSKCYPQNQITHNRNGAKRFFSYFLLFFISFIRSFVLFWAPPLTIVNEIALVENRSKESLETKQTKFSVPF